MYEMFCVRIVYHDILSHVLRFDEASGCVIFSVQRELASSLYANRLKTDKDHVIIATQSKKKLFEAMIFLHPLTNFPLLKQNLIKSCIDFKWFSLHRSIKNSHNFIIIMQFFTTYQDTVWPKNYRCVKFYF